MKRKFCSLVFLVMGCIAVAQNYPPPVKDICIGQTNLPIVFINTLGHEIDRENRVSAYMKIVNNPDGMNSGSLPTATRTTARNARSRFWAWAATTTGVCWHPIMTVR